MSTVMETGFEREALVTGRVTEGSELRDGVAREARRPGGFAIVVAFGAIAILGSVTWVVIPRPA